MEDIQISVIMPCYNDGRYIMEAIESVNLSYNLTTEIVVIDDGSDDPLTRKILTTLNHDRIRLCHTQHIGPSGARNHGIEQARGEFILPLDADDRIEHTYIHQAMKELQEHEQYGAVYCYADLFGREKGRWQLPAYSLDRMLLENVVFVTAMFRKSDWESIGGFRMDMEYGLEDYDFFLSILETGKEIYQIHYGLRVQRNSKMNCWKQASCWMMMTRLIATCALPGSLNNCLLWKNRKRRRRCIFICWMCSIIFAGSLYEQGIYSMRLGSEERVFDS